MSPAAARLAGINLNRMKFYIFTISGALAGLAGVLVTARFLVGSNPEDAAIRIEEKLRANWDRKPVGIPDPMVTVRGINDVPILVLTLTPKRGAAGQWNDASLYELAAKLRTEIAKRCHPVHTVLISSIPLSTHLPSYFRAASALRLHKVVPVGLIKMMAKTKRLISAEKNDDKKLLWQIIDETDPHFIRWAFEAILQWNNTDKPSPLSHIHGARDEVLPARYTTPTHTIHRAGHMMVMTRPAAINSILQATLAG